MDELHVEEISAQTIVAVNALSLKPGEAHDLIDEQGNPGPEVCFAKVGFDAVGETEYGDVLARLDLALGASRA